MSADHPRVLGTALTETGRRLHLSDADLMRMTGLNETEVTGLSHGDDVLIEKTRQWDQAVLLIRFYEALSNMVEGDDELAQAWMWSPNQAFGGAPPVEMMKLPEGLAHVVSYLVAHAK